MSVALILAIPALVLTVLLLGIGALIRRRRRSPRFGRSRRLGLFALVFVVSWVVVVPAVLGLAASGFVRTRHFERGYLGPQVDAEGMWSPPRLAEDRDAVDPEESSIAERLQVRAADGTPIVVYAVPPQAEARAVVVLAHGLFRSAFEIDPVGRMFHELGCAVFLVELRNHGDSGRPGCSFGQNESLDVLAAVAAAEARFPEAPLVLFGVSLGSVAVARAAPEVEGLRALVLDAPFADLGATARRYLGRVLPDPFLTVTLASMQWGGGFEFDGLRSTASLARLSTRLPVLVVGGGDDVIATTDSVRAVFESLPSKSISTLWIEPSVAHGRVWSEAPVRYRAELERLLVAATRPR